MENNMTVEQNTYGFDIQLHAYMTFPNGFDKEKESLPMIVFLHGAGERGDDIEKVKIYAIPKLFSANNEYLGMRVITMSPQCPEDMVWAEFLPQLFKFISETAKKFNADPDRISLTGLSMGGFGTWSLACSHPEFFSAFAPVCGGGMEWRTDRLGKAPIRAYHGDLDTVVDISKSRDMVAAAKRNGADATLTVCEGWGHDSWTPAYEQSEDLIRFLYNSKRVKE